MDLKLRASSITLMAVIVSAATVTRVLSQNFGLPYAIQEAIPQNIKQSFRSTAIPGTAVPSPPDAAKISADRARETAANFVGRIASQATSVKVEYLLIPDNVPPPVASPAPDDSAMTNPQNVPVRTAPPVDRITANDGNIPTPEQRPLRPTWVVTFDGVAAPPSRPIGATPPPPDTKAYLQTVVFVDSTTGEVWRAIEQGKQP